MNKFLLALLASAMCLSVKAADDTRKITVTPYVAENSGVPQASMAVLESKLKSLVTQSGFGATSGDRIILTAHVTPISEDITPTAPPVYIYTLNFDLYIGDGFGGTLFNTLQIEGKGSGKTKDQAYLAALKSLNPNNPKLKAFIKEGQEKVLEYYELNGPSIIKKAESLAALQKYDEAAFELMSIPEGCTALYDQANNVLEAMFIKQVNEEGKRYLAAARNEWSSGQNKDAAERAGQHLAKINPSSVCYKEAESFQQEIAKHIKAIDNREWSFKMQQYKDDTAYRSKLLASQTKLESQRISAARDMYVAAASRPNIVYRYSWW